LRTILRTARNAVKRLRPAPVILMYHRIAEPTFDPWGLAVSPHHFEEQLDILLCRREPLAMSEFAKRLKQGRLSARAVAITFDDGYVDNLRAALPSLADREIPATLFLATHSVGQRVEYWWDELCRLILGRQDRLDAVIRIGGEEVALTLEPLSDPMESATWRAFNPPATTRQVLYLTLWNKMRPLENNPREAVMAELRVLFGSGTPASQDLPMSAAEIRDLVAGGTVALGGHSTTHPILPRLSPAEQRREILEGKAVCEALAGHPIDGFAYPYGELSADTKALVQESGFDWACSTRQARVNRMDTDYFDLPRIQVTNMPADAFQAALSLI